MSGMDGSVHSAEWSPERECGGIAVVPGAPVWCETHMQQFGHRREGDPVPCSCGGYWATRTTFGKHEYDRRFEPPIIHTPTTQAHDAGKEQDDA